MNRDKLIDDLVVVFRRLDKARALLAKGDAHGGEKDVVIAMRLLGKMEEKLLLDATPIYPLPR